MRTTGSDDGSILPFPPTPTASTAGYTLAESSHQRRVDPPRLPEDAPNILIVFLDDVGFGCSDVVGGEVHTPTFARVAQNGLSYNTFHTTSICSPTRAALLTGRNHHRVHSGTIAERALDWDGYTGVIGKDTATIAEGAAALRLLHGRVRQVAQLAGHPDHRDGAVRPLAHGTRLRLLLRLPRRRDVAVGAPAVREPQPDRTAARREATTCPRTSPTSDLVAAQARVLRTGQAVLHVLGAGAVHGPHHIFPTGPTSTPASSTTAGTPTASGCSPGRRKLGWIPATRSSRRGRHHAGLGRHPRSRSARSSAA